jgi:cell division protein FtsI/penicillin-binding protein 2
MKVCLIIAFVLLVCFSLRIGYIQFIMGSKLKSMAYIQQTLDRKINPKRGTIYDATR